ncbi:hypothetical protein [Mycobacteroides abscessus]|uniref:hypothetical protein n=1 Tax=Mycobacteroides abscessus TaxID=36809 RepID=UPI0012FFECBE|nr:hypothetical protein [Mycobacteroides abscessus]
MTKLFTAFLRYRESIKLGAVLGSLIANFIILGIVFDNSQQTSDLASRVRQLVISQDREDTKQRKDSEARLARALEENAKEHQKTQRYMLCIAKGLLKPLAERDFNECGLVGVTGQIEQNSQPVPPKAPASQSPGVVTPQPSPAPTSPKPTTSAPPDPDRHTGLVGGILNTLDGIVRWLF